MKKERNDCANKTEKTTSLTAMESAIVSPSPQGRLHSIIDEEIHIINEKYIKFQLCSRSRSLSDTL
jgi:hypothetical protein